MPDLPEAPEGERALVTKFAGLIEAAKRADKTNVGKDTADKMRQRVKGFDDKGKRFRANVIGSTLRAMLPHIYAQNPELRISPSDSVLPDRIRAVQSFAHTCTVVLNNEFKAADFKRKAKAAVRSGQTVAVGWIKAVFQNDIREDPAIRQRLNDTQDNIRHVEMLMAKAADPELGQHEAILAELQEATLALQEQLEVTVYRGMAYDYVRPECLLILGEVDSFHGYKNALGIADCRFLNKEEFKAEFGRDPEGGHNNNLSEAPPVYSSADGEKPELFKVWEIWHKPTSTVYTWCEGESRWCRAPFRPRVGEHWYPYFPVSFNSIDGQFLGPSDVDELYELAQEYELIGKDRQQAIKNGKPFLITSSETDERDIMKRALASGEEILTIDISSMPGRSLREVFDQNSPNFNPMIYDVLPTRADIELISGLGDAQRGNIVRAKTLGEAELQREGLASRTGERLDVIEDWFVDIATYSLQILLEQYSPAEVLEIAGPGAMWPEMDIQQRFQLLSIEVKAGSSGKPNQAEEQERWAKMLLPELKELNLAIMQYVQQGLDVSPLIALAEETLRRFDEKIDVTKFIPQVPQLQQQMMLMGALNGGAAGVGPDGQPAGGNVVPIDAGVDGAGNAGGPAGIGPGAFAGGGVPLPIGPGTGPV